MRGETLNWASLVLQAMGPSPRARGNRFIFLSFAESRGSIPACAGKPRTLCACVCGTRVHPRVRGETMIESAQWPNEWGPSPRARGNRPPGVRRQARNGSIPACAGKPPGRTSRSGSIGVHPRVRGETCAPVVLSWIVRGPSPRARGNRESVTEARSLYGSIPACAGKPTSR